MTFFDYLYTFLKKFINTQTSSYRVKLLYSTTEIPFSVLKTIFFLSFVIFYKKISTFHQSNINKIRKGFSGFVICVYVCNQIIVYNKMYSYSKP